jgi:hypothetical protein
MSYIWFGVKTSLSQEEAFLVSRFLLYQFTKIMETDPNPETLAKYGFINFEF